MLYINGGLNYSANNNIVRSYISNSEQNNTNNYSGLPNSKEIFKSHIDLDGNSILHTGCVYFQDGTSICTGNLTGAQGAQGPQGFDGAQGATGAQGPYGITGQGTTGAQGATGFQGPTGVQGFQGNQGLQGVTGFQGPTGVQGFQGNQGPQGLQGVTGTQGPQGLTTSYWNANGNDIYANPPGGLTGFVGIGKISPSYNLDVSGTIRSNYIINQFYYLYDITTDTSGSIIYQAGTVLNYDNDKNSSSHNFAVNDAGGVQIIPLTLTSTINYMYVPLTVTGIVTATSFNATSDYRIKKDIEPLELSEYNIDNLKPVKYKYKENNKISIGLIAHELQEEYPFLVNGEKDGKNIQSVNYEGIIPILIKEIQSLKKRVTELEEKI